MANYLFKPNCKTRNFTLFLLTHVASVYRIFMSRAHRYNLEHKTYLSKLVRFHPSKHRTP